MKILLTRAMALSMIILFGVNQSLQASSDSQETLKVVATFPSGHQEWRGNKYGPAGSQFLPKECLVVAGEVICQ